MTDADRGPATAPTNVVINDTIALTQPASAPESAPPQHREDMTTQGTLAERVYAATRVLAGE